MMKHIEKNSIFCSTLIKQLLNNPDKIYTIEEIKSILQSTQQISPYTYKHIIMQLLNSEIRSFMLVKHLDKYNMKPEDFVTY